MARKCLQLDLDSKVKSETIYKYLDKNIKFKHETCTRDGYRHYKLYKIEVSTDTNKFTTEESLTYVSISPRVP